MFVLVAMFVSMCLSLYACVDVFVRYVCVCVCPCSYVCVDVFVLVAMFVSMCLSL